MAASAMNDSTASASPPTERVYMILCAFERMGIERSVKRLHGLAHLLPCAWRLGKRSINKNQSHHSRQQNSEHLVLYSSVGGLTLRLAAGYRHLLMTHKPKKRSRN